MTAQHVTPPGNEGDNHPTGPYAQAFDTYYDAGWRGVLPLPPRRKSSPPDGYTGNDGTFPSYGDLLAWSEDRGAGNIALRMPRDIIGIDVDAYGDKIGGKTFSELLVKYGALPPTWRSTSRDDGMSAIRFYRIPEGLHWPSILGPGIEVIRYAHRYAVVWPSLHPEGRTYRWIDPTGQSVIGVVPNTTDLPPLPDTWIQGLTGGELERTYTRADLTDTATHEWITTHGGGRPCHAIHTLLSRYVLDLNVPGGARHDAALKATRALVEMAGEGHPGVAHALSQVHDAFTRAIGDDPERAGEWDRMVTGAVRLAAAHHPNPAATDPCDNPLHGLMLPPIAPRTVTAPNPRSETTWTPTNDPTPTAPAVTTSSTTEVVSGRAGDAPAEDGSTPTSDTAADDLLALRQQYLLQELERERARREVKRLLDREEALALEHTDTDRLTYLGWDDLDNLPEPAWMIDGLVPQGGVGYITGRDGTYKTFLALDFVLSIVTQQAAWLGRPITTPGHPRALYLAGEGVRSFAARRDAWCHNRRVTPTPAHKTGLLVRDGTVDLHAGTAAFDQLLTVVAAHRPALIVVDTLARSVGGADQNSAADMGVVRGRIEELKRVGDPGATILIVAHTDKGDNDARGSSTIEDDADFVLHCKRDDDERRLKVRVHKMKDGPDKWDLELGVQTVTLDDTGTTSLALTLPTAESTRWLGDSIEHRIRTMLYHARGTDAPSGAQVIAWLREDGTGRDASKPTVMRALGDLERDGVLVSERVGTSKRYTLDPRHYPVGIDPSTGP